MVKILSIVIDGNEFPNDAETGTTAEFTITDDDTPPPPPPPPAVDAIAVDEADNLHEFNAATPGTIDSTRALVGLVPGDSVQKLDFRPLNGDLFGTSSADRLYLILPATGSATAVALTPCAPGPAGMNYGIDFDAALDRLRMVSASDLNVRVHPQTGAVTGVDASVAYAAGDPNVGMNPAIGAIAYGPDSTLFGIDTSFDVLVRIGGVGGAPGADTGTLVTIGPLGFDTIADFTAFDIGAGGEALAALTAPAATTSQLFAVDLATGAATEVGVVAAGGRIRGLAIPP